MTAPSVIPSTIRRYRWSAPWSVKTRSPSGPLTISASTLPERMASSVCSASSSLARRLTSSDWTGDSRVRFMARRGVEGKVQAMEQLRAVGEISDDAPEGRRPPPHESRHRDDLVGLRPGRLLVDVDDDQHVAP